VLPVHVVDQLDGSHGVSVAIRTIGLTCRCFSDLLKPERVVTTTRKP